MQIDPKVAMIVKIVLGLLTAISTGTLSLAGIVNAQQATLIIAVCSSLVTIIGIVMSAFSSSAPGPLAPQDSPAVVAATKSAAIEQIKKGSGT
jgi:hypothetical protein